MKARIVVLAIAISASVGAGPRKVLVLALDGNASPPVRVELTAVVQRLSRNIDGKVTMGDTTLGETAAAVGCDPAKPKCVDSVLATLAVDELVWGTATTTDGKTTLVVHRATKGTPPHDQTVTVTPGDPPNHAEGELAPLFGGVAPVAVAPVAVAPGSGSGLAGSGSSTDAGSALPPGPPVDSRDRNLGLGLAIGGGAALVVGFALWASESSLQAQIDAHPKNTLFDLQALVQLEDKANSYAWGGNVMVLVGLAVGGAGAYYLWRDHEHRTTTLAPAPVEHGTGMTLVLGGRW